MHLNQTFSNFLLQHQLKQNRTLNFMILMESLVNAARYIQFHYCTAALNNNLGGLGIENVQGEEIMKIDQLANSIIMHCLEESGQVMGLVSEEIEEPQKVNPEGRYFIYFDPLDGSSNIKHALPVGFMFGIAKRDLHWDEDYHLRAGQDFIAAGMFNIPSGIFTFSLKGSGTWRFFLDETGVFVSPEKVMIPNVMEDAELSYNASYLDYFPKNIKSWINENSAKYAFRYSGALATDFHRLMTNGGLYFYPSVTGRPEEIGKDYPKGKLRVMYEAAVAAFMIKEAGGYAVSDSGQDILEIKPEEPHQRSSIILGNRELIDSLDL